MFLEKGRQFFLLLEIERIIVCSHGDRGKYISCVGETIMYCIFYDTEGNPPGDRGAILCSLLDVGGGNPGFS